MDPVGDDLGRDAAREGVERSLRRHVGGEARRVGLDADARHVHDVPEVALAHPGKEREDQLERTEVVELDRALVVVEAVVRGLDGAADRAARVVYEDVDAAVRVEDLMRDALDVLEL